ncbi:MAG: PPC domain-containing DNA-binding protein [Syntrophobacteraceae bacterium]
MEIDITSGRKVMGRLLKGDDLLTALENYCEKLDIRLGEVRAIGAVSSARIGYYDQASLKYEFHDLKKPMEILSLVGNISIKENKPFIHAHIILGDENGAALGGHLAEGATVFACEFVIQEFISSEPLVRKFDEETGLFLWAGKWEA